MSTFRWRIYYEDGSTFSDTDGLPWESPPWGVIAVGQPGHEPSVYAGNGDFYLYREDLGYWHEVGDSGLIDHLVHYGHKISCVRPGRWIPETDRYARILQRARTEVAGG